MKPRRSYRPQIPAVAGRPASRLGAGLVVVAPRCALLVAAAVTIALAPGPLAAAGPAAAGEKKSRREIAAKKLQIRQLVFEKEQVGRQIREFRDSERELTGKIERLSDEVRTVRRRLKKLSAGRAAKKRLQRKRRAEVGLLEGRIAANKREVAGHFTRLYRLSKAGQGATLLSLAKHRDFFKNRRYLATLINADRKKIIVFERANRTLGQKQAEIERALAEVAALEVELKRERRNLADSKKKLRRSLGQIRKNRRVYGKYLQELEGLRAGMEAALAALERSAQPPTPALADSRGLRGRLPPPVKGVIIAPFGKQDPRYQLKKFQRGIVIRVAPDATVSAVADGRVVHAGPFRGYQGLAVLDHGHGLFTVYGHLEAMKITKGGVVMAGGALGTATFQPVDGAYNLYFEIRLNGKPVDPQKWISPGKLALAAVRAPGG